MSMRMHNSQPSGEAASWHESAANLNRLKRQRSDP